MSKSYDPTVTGRGWSFTNRFQRGDWASFVVVDQMRYDAVWRWGSFQPGLTKWQV
jgi:hypothetical protein